MKGIGCFIACILMIIGLGLYAIQDSLQNIITENIANEVVDQITNTALAQLNDVSSFLPEGSQEKLDQITSQLPEDMQSQINEHMNDALPEAVQEKLDDVKSDIVKDEMLNDLSQKYMGAMLSGVIGAESELPDVNADMQNLAQAYVPKISEATGVEISEEQVQKITTELSERVDLQGVMNNAVEKLNASLSPEQKQILSLIHTIQTGPMFAISIGFMLAGLILVIICTLHPLKWMIYAGGCALVSGLVLLGGSKVAEMILQDKLAQVAERFMDLGSGVFAALFQSGIWFTAIGVVLLLLYGLFHFVKEHIAYE